MYSLCVPTPALLSGEWHLQLHMGVRLIPHIDSVSVCISLRAALVVLNVNVYPGSWQLLRCELLFVMLMLAAVFDPKGCLSACAHFTLCHA